MQNSMEMKKIVTTIKFYLVLQPHYIRTNIDNYRND